MRHWPNVGLLLGQRLYQCLYMVKFIVFPISVYLYMVIANVLYQSASVITLRFYISICSFPSLFVYPYPCIVIYVVIANVLYQCRCRFMIFIANVLYQCLHVSYIPYIRPYMFQDCCIPRVFFYHKVPNAQPNLLMAKNLDTGEFCRIDVSDL